MMLYPVYRPSGQEAGAFLARSPHGRIVTVGEEGYPRLGLHPYVYAAEGNGVAPRVELHLHREDPLLADLRREPKCLFEVDEPLSIVPSYWIDPEDGSNATLYHRTALLSCRASVIEDRVTLRAHLRQLMDKHQPEGGFPAFDAAPDTYDEAFALLALVRLEVVKAEFKFKLAQNRTSAVREGVAARLDERAGPADALTAERLRATIRGNRRE